MIWQVHRGPLADRDAIRVVVPAVGDGQADGPHIAAALVLTGAAHLDLDCLEAVLIEGARVAGMGDETIAAVLNLPNAEDAKRHRLEVSACSAPPPRSNPLPLLHPASQAQTGADTLGDTDDVHPERGGPSQSSLIESRHRGSAGVMRVAVLDVGSNSAHLKIVDLLAGDPPLPVRTVKRKTRLAESIDQQGAIAVEAVDRLTETVAETVAAAQTHDVDKVIAFATSAIRDAANRDEIVARVKATSDVELGFIPGRDEARLTFLAARRWHGWSAGQMLLLDIGGGSLEIASGDGTEPQVARSVPLGAGRLTRDHLPGSPPRRKHVRRLHRYVREVLPDVAKEFSHQPHPVRAVATSKTFSQLARLTGAPKAKAGIYADRQLTRKHLHTWIPRLASMDDSQRAKLRGISKSRAHQVLAGAIVAEEAMSVLGLDRVDICPWALREGIILCELDELTNSGTRGFDDTHRPGPVIPGGASSGGPPHLHTVQGGRG